MVTVITEAATRSRRIHSAVGSPGRVLVTKCVLPPALGADWLGDLLSLEGSTITPLLTSTVVDELTSGLQSCYGWLPLVVDMYLKDVKHLSDAVSGGSQSVLRRS